MEYWSRCCTIIVFLNVVNLTTMGAERIPVPRQLQSHSSTSQPVAHQTHCSCHMGTISRESAMILGPFLDHSCHRLSTRIILRKLVLRADGRTIVQQGRSRTRHSKYYRQYPLQRLQTVLLMSNWCLTAWQ